MSWNWAQCEIKDIFSFMIWAKLIKWAVKELQNSKYEKNFSSWEVDIWRYLVLFDIWVLNTWNNTYNFNKIIWSTWRAKIPTIKIWHIKDNTELIIWIHWHIYQKNILKAITRTLRHWNEDTIANKDKEQVRSLESLKILAYTDLFITFWI